MVHDGPKTMEFNLLHVDAAHAGDGVAHDSMNGMLIVRLVGPRAERVAQRVEADAPPLEG